MSQSIQKSARIPPELGGSRVDQAAAVLFAEFSRVALGRWIRAGLLTVDGQPCKPKTRVIGGERLVLAAELVPREDWRSAQEVPFSVVYEDESLLVVNKPAGVVVHPGAGNPDGTLVNGLLAYRPALALLPRGGIVHRLDKDTSGLMIIAADVEVHHALVKAIQRREVAREYLAVVEGRLNRGAKIDRPIGRDPHVRTRQRVSDAGKPARTHVSVVSRFRVHTLVAAVLDTGRTHQIRVHMASLGMPLVGDRRYGAQGRRPPGADDELIRCIAEFRRQALHAERLSFVHPRSGKPQSCSAPPPADLERLIALLEADAARDLGSG